MKGFRTLTTGLAMALLPPAFTYLAHVDWTQWLGPNAALALSGLITIGLRCITTTEIGKAA